MCWLVQRAHLTLLSGKAGTCRWHPVINNSRHARTSRSQSQLRVQRLHIKFACFRRSTSCARRKQRLVLGAEDVGEQTRPGFADTAAWSGRNEQNELLVRKDDVSMALVHRHNPRPGVVSLRLRSHGDTVLFMFPLLLLCPADIRKQWAREQHSNWWRDEGKPTPGSKYMLRSRALLHDRKWVTI